MLEKQRPNFAIKYLFISYLFIKCRLTSKKIFEDSKIIRSKKIGLHMKTSNLDGGTFETTQNSQIEQEVRLVSMTTTSIFFIFIAVSIHSRKNTRILFYSLFNIN